MEFYTNIPFEIKLKRKNESSHVTITLPSIKPKSSFEKSISLKTRIPVFSKYDGNYYFRYSSSIAGNYSYEYGSQKGKFSIKQYKGNNRLFKHGPITVSKENSYFTHEDGTPFFWLADTWWYGGTKRATWPDVFKKLVKDRKSKGFTVVQMVVGIPPETDAFSKDAQNTGGLPFEKDCSINKRYFEEIDKKIDFLVKSGIVPCIVGGWGNHIGFLGEDRLIMFWDEIIVRYSPYPVIFCLCGEANLLFTPNYTMSKEKHKLKNKIIELAGGNDAFRVLVRTKHKVYALYHTYKQNENLKIHLEKWDKVARYIQKNNFFRKPLTVHVAGSETACSLFSNPGWIAIDSFQSGHDNKTLPFMVQSIRKDRKKNMPVINMEPWYEGILGNFGEYHQRLGFWACILTGAKGHSYGAHGIWQMSENNENFMKHWGKSYWMDSLNYKGSSQLGESVAFLRNYEWWKIEESFKSVSPSWNKNNTDFPFTGQIDNNYYFIYLPDRKILKKLLFQEFEKGEKYKADYFNPRDLKKIDTQYLDNEDIPLHFDKDTDCKDLLIVISN